MNQTRSHAWPIWLVALALSACHPGAPWDQEFTCSGEEQSLTAFDNPTDGASVNKTYPLSVDFHIRGQQAVVKTFTPHIEQSSPGVLSFGVQNQVARLNGTFNTQTQVLELVEERYLQTPLGAQTARSSGRFVCKPV